MLPIKVTTSRYSMGTVHEEMETDKGYHRQQREDEFKVEQEKVIVTMTGSALENQGQDNFLTESEQFLLDMKNIERLSRDFSTVDRRKSRMNRWNSMNDISQALESSVEDHALELEIEKLSARANEFGKKYETPLRIGSDYRNDNATSSIGHHHEEHDGRQINNHKSAANDEPSSGHVFHSSGSKNDSMNIRQWHLKEESNSRDGSVLKRNDQMDLEVKHANETKKIVDRMHNSSNSSFQSRLREHVESLLMSQSSPNERVGSSNPDERVFGKQWTPQPTLRSRSAPRMRSKGRRQEISVEEYVPGKRSTQLLAQSLKNEIAESQTMKTMNQTTMRKKKMKKNAHNSQEVPKRSSVPLGTSLERRERRLNPTELRGIISKVLRKNSPKKYPKPKSRSVVAMPSLKKNNHYKELNRMEHVLRDCLEKYHEVAPWQSPRQNASFLIPSRFDIDSGIVAKRDSREVSRAYPGKKGRKKIRPMSVRKRQMEYWNSVRNGTKTVERDVSLEKTKTSKLGRESMYNDHGRRSMGLVHLDPTILKSPSRSRSLKRRALSPFWQITEQRRRTEPFSRFEVDPMQGTLRVKNLKVSTQTASSSSLPNQFMALRYLDVRSPTKELNPGPLLRRMDDHTMTTLEWRSSSASTSNVSTPRSILKDNRTTRTPVSEERKHVRFQAKEPKPSYSQTSPFGALNGNAFDSNGTLRSSFVDDQFNKSSVSSQGAPSPDSNDSFESAKEAISRITKMKYYMDRYGVAPS